MGAAGDMLSLFVGLETMSISTYALVGFKRHSERSAEGSMKYFLLGALSTAILLYGIALVYGATGTTNLTGIAKFLAGLFTLAVAPAPLALVAANDDLFIVITGGPAHSRALAFVRDWPR